VRCEVDPEHLLPLTRDKITASVHYVHFGLDDGDVAAMAEGPVSVAATHENYRYETRLTEIPVSDLVTDLRP
jgi:hypothetical protein